jgi:glycosyltransferase involved in cell wall biosynthesis
VNKTKLLLVDYLCTEYRKYYYEELATLYDFSLSSTKDEIKQGFNTVSINAKRVILDEISFWNGKIKFQKGMIPLLQQLHPRVIICALGNRYLNQWILLLYCKWKKIDLYLHDPGPYSKTQYLAFYRLMYKLILLCCKGIICYTPFSKESFLKIGIRSKKLFVAENSIYNDCDVSPNEKNYKEKGILFIGRLREGSRLDILINAVNSLRNIGFDVFLHIIGDGEFRERYLNKFKNTEFIQWHGKIYDSHEIARISKECLLACYPGNAGLSLVHYMSLSLPILTNNNVAAKCGPEASYIRDNYNGWFFDYDHAETSLFEKLKEILNHGDDIARLGHNAYRTYYELTHPSYAQRVHDIIEKGLSG